MKVTFDDELVKIRKENGRNTDARQYCMFAERTYSNQDDFIIDSHCHEWIEILYLLEGALTVFTADGEFEIKSGEAIFIGTRNLHKMHFKAGTIRFQTLFINVGFVIRLLKKDRLASRIFKILDVNKFRDYLEIIIANMNNNSEIGKLRYRGALMLLLAELSQESTSESEEDYEKIDNLLEKIMKYMSSQYKTSEVSLDSTAKYFGYSPQYISTLFRKKLNMTFSDYLLSLKLSKAKFLLHNCDDKVIDIAFECGFSNDHTFIKAFKKKFGVTPLQYRKKRSTE